MKPNSLCITSLLVALLPIAIVACKEQATNKDCTVGSEACPCTQGGACDAGLQCLSGLCVRGSKSNHDSSQLAQAEPDSEQNESGDEEEVTTAEESSSPKAKAQKRDRRRSRRKSKQLEIPSAAHVPASPYGGSLKDNNESSDDEGKATAGPKEQGGSSKRIPRVRLAHLKVQGTGNADIVRRVLVAQKSEVRHCYNKGLMQSPSLDGTVTLDLAIDTKGNVQDPEVAKSTIGDREVTACIVRRAKQWHFPTGVGPAKAKCRYELSPG